MAQLSFERWQRSTSAASIDFFTLWSVPHTAALTPETRIYTPAGQLELGAVLARESTGPTTPPPQRMAAAVVLDLYGGRIDATATPFAYTVVGLLSSGDYPTDLRRFIVVSWIAFAVSIVLICSLLRFSPVATVLAFLVFTSCFAPLQADLRVANVNQVQLLGVALFLWGIAYSRRWLAGAVLGAAIVFKPNLAPVLAFLLVVAATDGRWRRWLGVFGGAAAAMAAGVAVSAAWFGDAGIWAAFASSLDRTTAMTYPLENGNFGLPALVFAWSGWNVSWVVGLGLAGAFTGVAIRSRPGVGAPGASPPSARAEAEPAGERDVPLAFLVAGTGCAVMLLASNLAWLHYYVLLIPLALYLLRPVPDDDPDRRRKLACGAAAVAALLLFSSSAQQVAGGARAAAVLVNAATLLLFVAALDDLWRQRMPSTVAGAPGPRPRARHNGRGRAGRQSAGAVSRLKSAPLGFW